MTDSAPALRPSSLPAPPAATATELAAAARSGDGRAVEHLWSTVRPWLLRVALSLGTPPDDASDLVQDTLWAAHRHLARFDGRRSSFEAWVVTILVRRAHNARRSLWRRLRLGRAVVASDPARGDAHRASQAAVDARLTLERLLEALTDRQRRVIALYEIAELPAVEVARVLGLTEAGVRSLACDARARLAEVAQDAPPRTEKRP